MKRNALWITQTALMLALLITLQWITKPFGQIITGTCVNLVLAVTALMIGLGSGMAVAILSPLFAYVLGIAPQLLTVPVIMAGNALYITMLHFAGAGDKKLWKKIRALLAASIGKFGVLYFLAVYVVCGIGSEFLIGQGLLKQPMLQVLRVNFSMPQLVTALAGGALALGLLPMLKKVTHRNK